MDTNKYLERIGYCSEIKATKEVLFLLQQKHLLSIPFENLDIHYGIKIDLKLQNIFEKVVVNKRGGFCYELNSLFNELLKAIGFITFLISGRVYVENDTYGQEFDHMAIIVRLENKSYLVDVGFGKFSFEPLEILIGFFQIDEYGTFVIDKHSEDYYRVNKIENSKKTPEYIFKLKERNVTEFIEMCNYHQSSQESHFTKNKVISLTKPNGRITLTNTTYKITEHDKTKTVKFEETEFENYLKKIFDIQFKKKQRTANLGLAIWQAEALL